MVWGIDWLEKQPELGASYFFHFYKVAGRKLVLQGLRQIEARLKASE